MRSKLLSGAIVAAALGLCLLFSCSKDEPTAPTPIVPETPPSVAIVVYGNSHLSNFVVPIDIVAQRGTDSCSVRASVRRDSAVFDTAFSPATQEPETLRIRHSFPSGNYEIQAEAVTAETTVVRTMPFTVRNIVVNVQGTQGPAPLTARVNLLTDGSFTSQARITWGDGQDTLAQLPAGYLSTSFSHTYGLGEFVLQVEVLQAGGDTALAESFAVQSYNTPPQLVGSLDDLGGEEDNVGSFIAVPLEPLFFDSLTPAAELSYRILTQHGPAVAAIDSLHVLRIGSLQADGNGAGEIALLVEDPQGLSVQAVVNTYTEPLPDVMIYLEDYNGNPISEGMIVRITDGNYNGVQVPITQQPLIMQGTPGQFLIGGWATNAGQGASFQRTLRPNLTTNDTTLHIPVIPYSILSGICTPDEFYDLTGEARSRPMYGPDGEFYWGLAKMRLDSAALGFQNGGITIYIEKQPYPQGNPADSLSDAEQDSIENVILNMHHPYFPPNARAQIYKARWEDPTYLEYGVGPTVQNIITIHKESGANPSVTCYDDNLDGIIDRAAVSVNHLLAPVAILQEVVSAEIAPEEVMNALPYRTVLQSIYPAQSIQPVDSLIIDTGLKIPAGTRINDMLYGR